MVLVPGQNVDRFEVVRLLGEGGLAHVYLVRHRRLGSDHALKVLHVRGERARARFLQEGQVQARIRHPNLVPVTDVVELEDGIGLVMDFVDGPSLAEVLGGDEPLARRDVPPLFDQMCRGIVTAHRAGVLHRDLKPGNVLLSVSGHGIEARITDFGIAKVVADFRDTPSLTEQGSLMGTIGYMSPEQLSDARSVDARADVFSLGCILYEMLAGKAPYLRKDRAASIRASLDGDHRLLREAAPDLPERLCAAVERAIAPDPAQRFDSVEQLRLEVAAAAAPLLAPERPPAATPSAPASARPAPPPTQVRAGEPAPARPAPPARETIAPPPTLVRPDEPAPARPAPPARETIAPPPTLVRPEEPAPTAVPAEAAAVPAPEGWSATERQATPAPRGRLLEETGAPRAEAERPRPESDRPLVDFERNRRSGLRTWLGVLLLAAAGFAAAGAFLAAERADDIAAADRTALTLAAGLERRLQSPGPPLADAVGRSGGALEAPTAALHAATTVGERVTRARELVRALRTELARQGREGAAPTTELARAGGQVEPMDEAVREAEAALQAADALRGGWEARIGDELGWIERPTAATLAVPTR